MEMRWGKKLSGSSNSGFVGEIRAGMALALVVTSVVALVVASVAAVELVVAWASVATLLTMLHHWRGWRDRDVIAGADEK